MGDRGQICMQYDGETSKRVYFYTHWNGDKIPEILRAALERGESRWGDDCYLPRIIFSEMIKGEGDVLDTTGYGIDLAQHGDIEHPVPIVDLQDQSIFWEPCDFGWGHMPPKMSFKEFLAYQWPENDD